MQAPSAYIFVYVDIYVTLDHGQVGNVQLKFKTDYSMVLKLKLSVNHFKHCVRWGGISMCSTRKWCAIFIHNFVLTCVV